MSGVVSISEAPTTGLGRLLMENRFFVPTHQRDYRWDGARVAQFLDDLSSAMEREDAFYFIGLMVFMLSEDGRLRVLDGQQRLATAIIILSAIRAWFGSNEAGQETARQIQADFIGRSELGETSILPKISLNYNNDQRFQRYVVDGSPIIQIRMERANMNKNAPNYDLLNAIILCHDRVSAIAGANPDASATARYLIRLARYIRDNVMVVRLTVPNEVNAFRVFETLNDRGLDLSAVDLVKNYLFGLAHSDSPSLLSNVENRWAQITQTLSSFKQDEFLKVYWTSRYGRTQLDDIFDDMKGRYRTGNEANELTIDLLESAEQYSALEVADDPVWNSYSRAVRSSVSSLSIIGSKQVRPVMLAALKRLSPREMERLLWLLEVVIVRYQLIGEERTGALEIQCARLAHQIWGAQIRTASEAAQALSSVYPPDDSFRHAFADKENVSSQKAQYLLKALENYERQINNPEMPRLGLHDSFTIEHILPRNPSDAWESVIERDPDIVSGFALRLGNLCLLSEGGNRALGRAGFEVKRRLYVRSDLITTRQVAEAVPEGEQWDRRKITRRQARMAQRAVAIWRFQ